MYKPGLSRAVPMGVIGFLAGALLVFILRALQSLVPIWDPGVGLVFGTFFSAGFFVWGMGGFDPSMSAHGDGEHGHDDAHAAHEEEVAAPTTILGYSVWQILFATIIMLSLIGVFAWLGPKLTTVASGDANVGTIGMVPMDLFGTEIVVSQLVIFVVVILFMFISLAVVAGGIGFVVNMLNRQLVETAPGNVAAAAALPAPTETPRRARPQWLSTLIFLVTFAVIFYVLYLLHYYVLIGLIFAWPEWQLTLASAGAAFTITLLILRGPWVVQLVARLSGWLAGVLRSRNNPYSGVRKNNRSNGQ